MLQQEHRQRYKIRPIYVEQKIQVFTKVENLSISSRARKPLNFVFGDLDLGVSVMKAVRDTPSSDGACVYEVSSNYVERSKTYGPDKQKVTVF
jgi:hypothetical protein